MKTPLIFSPASCQISRPTRAPRASQCGGATTRSSQASQVRSSSSGFHGEEPKSTADGPSYSFIVQGGLPRPWPDPPKQERIWPQVPPGYVLVPPNVLVPLDVLRKQMSQIDASQQMAQPGQWGIPAAYGLGVTGGRPTPSTGPCLQVQYLPLICARLLCIRLLLS